VSTVLGVELRARMSEGTNNTAGLYDLVKHLVISHHSGGGVVVDFGCGQGTLYSYLREHFHRYIGIDIVRYESFPEDSRVEFYEVDLDCSKVNLPDGLAEVVYCLERIEHVENPRALMRELVRLAKPGGSIIVSTPNQLSLLSKLCLLFKNEFVHFQERRGLYPAHLSVLLDVDLARLARENALTHVKVAYTCEGRMPLTARHWPTSLTARSGWRGRAFSDNVILFGRKAV